MIHVKLMKRSPARVYLIRVHAVLATVRMPAMPRNDPLFHSWIYLGFDKIDRDKRTVWREFKDTRSIAASLSIFYQTRKLLTQPETAFLRVPFDIKLLWLLNLYGYDFKLHLRQRSSFNLRSFKIYAFCFRNVCCRRTIFFFRLDP